MTLENLLAIVQHTIRSVNRNYLGHTGPYPGIYDSHTPEDYGPWPLGPSQLADLVLNQQIFSRYTSRTNILIQGNTRQCTGRRAEAIMSILGITNWFKEVSDPSERERDMVLGMYPLSFVNEAVKVIGPEFFLAQKGITSTYTSLDYFFGSARGSILPFSNLDPTRNRGRKDVKNPIYEVHDARFHPAIRSWTFNRNGSISMKQAGILGSTDSAHPMVMNAIVLLTQYQIHEVQIRLGEWLQKQPKYYCTYAVNISRDLGIILQGFQIGCSRPKHMIKVGCYEILDDADEARWILLEPFHWVPSQEVDWVVL